ncbi:2'-5' RNA ligase family protein [Bradyrhizobium sp. CIAT3101]|uniref:2'-5' RNA ligase family protein n=1 Tax=Bradyrhizobium sp. CIAT3101 TaxID=439387 RepID=UPI0024B11505|nr:2'-5' RNA ligase family protein [Bradyrhizobium sp. CIAT3101]WFU82596.1 2'-5' RNA ligase family protein [Bradyrhizobium sp. CIAT3101]
MTPTFLLTAELDLTSFAWLDGLRRGHFPPERNLLPAHLTLFHRLSSAQTARLCKVRLPLGPIPILLDTPLLLGFGVAIRVRSLELEQVRSAARLAMGGEFSSQDSQGWRPHVTIQNKVAADDARRLHRELSTGFEPRAGAATGLLVWEYLNGPWKLVDRLPFE